MIQPILRMGDPRLLERSRPVERFGTEELLALIGDLHETMVDAKGAGLAAPQIGVGLRVVIFGFEHNQRYPDAEPVPIPTYQLVIVPLAAERKKTGKAACRCHLRGIVPRFSRVRYTGFDPRCRPIDLESSGFHARVVQHECDHLDGVLYPMRMRDMRTLGFTSVLCPGVEMPDE